MKRKAEDKIKDWIANGKYPLIIFGARQIGKTFLIENYFKNSNYDFYEYNFLKDKQLCENFENSKKVVETLKYLAVDDNIDLTSSNTVIFFDEIQECGNLFEGLKYINIEFPKVHIVCAGSLVGVWLKKMSFSYPVGYVDEYNMYPLSFEEFLIATGNERYISYIKDSYATNKPLNDMLHNSLLEIYRTYLVLGGMPELVQNYIDNKNDILSTNFSIEDKIINEYYKDMSKYIESKNDKLRIRRIYDAIVPQLEKTNPKFTYAKLDKDDRKGDYIVALDWLVSANIVYECNQITNPIYPIKAYEDVNNYKLFLNDVGILCAKANIKRGVLKMDGDYPFKGVITENYVANELVQAGYKLLYYSKKNENQNGSEIDFVIQIDENVIPIEVKANVNTQSKSLNLFVEKYKSPYAIRISSKNFGFENGIKSVPLYAVFCIKDII